MGLQPTAHGHTCELCMYTVKISQYIRQLGVSNTNVGPPAVREPVHCNRSGSFARKLWRIVFYTQMKILKTCPTLMPPYSSHLYHIQTSMYMFCFESHRWHC